MGRGRRELLRHNLFDRDGFSFFQNRIKTATLSQKGNCSIGSPEHLIPGVRGKVCGGTWGRMGGNVTGKCSLSKKKNHGFFSSYYIILERRPKETSVCDSDGCSCFLSETPAEQTVHRGVCLHTNAPPVRAGGQPCWEIASFGYYTDLLQQLLGRFTPIRSS